MPSVPAALLAAVIGVTLHLMVLWLPVSVAPTSEGVIVTFVYSIVLAPFGFAALTAVLLVAAELSKGRPMASFAAPALAAVLLPLLVGRVLFMQAGPPWNDETPWGDQIVAATGPYFLAAIAFAALGLVHRRANPPLAKPKAGPPPAVAPSTPAKQPSPFAPVVLATPPTSERLIEIMTWPGERVGQRLFMYAIQLWAMAASVFFPLPFIAAAWFDLSYDWKVTIAAFGWMALFYSAFCITANRLHDLGVHTVWGAAPVLASLLWVIAEGEPEQSWFSTTTVTSWMFASVFCYGVAAAFLLMRKGEPYSNLYGSPQEE